MKKIILALCLIVGVVTVVLVLNPIQQKSPLSSPLTANLPMPKEAAPSEAMKDYSDPSGFGFSYPDNLSLNMAEIMDNTTYTDLQLSSKDVSGSLSLRIADSKFATIDDWLKLNQKAALEKPKEVKLGTLQATELKLKDRLLLGALDQGIFFSIEMPLVEEKFWTKVYDKVLANFSFAPPAANSQDASSPEDVSFEGEEVVE